LVADPQAPLPLQEFMPEHLTSAILVVGTLAAALVELLYPPEQPASSNVAVAVANDKPVIFDAIFIFILLWFFVITYLTVSNT
jgi:hypothetical protein